MLSWLPWIISGGTVTWIALAIFAPHVLTIITPLLEGLVKAFVELVRRAWEGFLDVIDNINTIIFVVLACLTWAWYSKEPPKIIYKDSPVTSKKVETKKTDTRPSLSLRGWDWFHR